MQHLQQSTQSNSIAIGTLLNMPSKIPTLHTLHRIGWVTGGHQTTHGLQRGSEATA